MDTLNFLGTLLCGFVFLYLWQFKWRPRRLLAVASTWPCPPTLPLLGNAHLALRGVIQLTNVMNEFTSKFDGLFCVWLGPLPLFMVAKPEDLKIILNSSKTIEKDVGYEFLKPFVGNGLITSPARIWKRNRRALNPVFHPTNLEGFLPVLNKINTGLVEKFSQLVDKEEHDVHNDLLMHGAESVCGTVLGLNIKNISSPISRFHTNFMRRVSRLLILRFTRFWLAVDSIFYFFYGKEIKELNSTLETLIDEMNKDLLTRKSEVKTNGSISMKGDVDDDDFNSLENDYLDARNFREILWDLLESDPTFTEEDMRFEIITTLAPGTDSFSSGMGFCLLSLASIKDVQDEVYKEIQTVFGTSDRDVTMDDIKEMQYLDCVVHESLRRHRIVPYVARQATEDIKLSTSMIPAGGRIIININGLNMNPSVFPDPEKFDPNRFLPENRSKRHPYSLMSFSAGPRNCIAKNYTTLGMKVAVIHLLRKFEISTNLKLENIVYKLEISHGSENGFPLMFKLRNK